MLRLFPFLSQCYHSFRSFVKNLYRILWSISPQGSREGAFVTPYEILDRDRMFGFISGNSLKKSDEHGRERRMSASQGRVVVVKSPVAFETDPKTNVVLARFESLGLTGYGVTADHAVASLKHLFHAFIHAHRKYETLQEQLERSGVEWYWEDEYPEDGGEYENMNELFGPGGDVVKAIAASTRSEWEDRTGTLAAAA